MKDQTHLTLRGKTYWFRCRIPADLVTQYGKKEVSFSLKTKDKKEALAKTKLESLRITQEFDHKRSLRDAESIQELTQIEIDRIAALYLSQILEEDEEHRNEGLTDKEYKDLEEAYAIVGDHEAYLLARGRPDLDNFEVADFLDSHGIRIAQDSELYRRVSLAMLKASRKATEMMKARHAGDVVKTPQAEPVVIRSDILDPKEDTLDYLSTYWQTKANRGRSSIAEAKTIIKKFKSMVEDIPPSKIDKKHIIQLEDKMLESGAAPATINKGIGILGAILQTAFDNGKLKANPCQGRKKLKVAELEAEKPYTAEELKTIFTSPVFSKGERPTAGRGEAAFWMPLIGLYTGARVAEVGQLYVEDVKEEQGIWYFHIKNDAETDRRVKNSGSVRRVPIHPDLIAMGILDYLDATKKAGHKQLFPALKVTREGGKLTDKWRGWWSEYVRGLGITRIPKPFHSFRDTFKDACRVCDVSYEVHQRLTGHSSGNEGDKYGSKLFPLKPLSEGMNKVAFHGLDLSHLKKP